MPMKLLTSNYSSFLHEVSATSLSQTFQDAINFTRIIGVQYMWIDAMCIIQDSKADWLLEAPRMDRVYAKSVVNIAATASKDNNRGVFRHKNPLEIAPCKIKDGLLGIHDRCLLAYYHSSLDGELSTSPVNVRGWVIQETILAPRTLHFAKDQIYWQCDSLVACETWPRGLPGKQIWPHRKVWRTPSMKGKASAFGRSAPIEPWDQAVRRFAQCRLTFESEKLVALAEIARRMCDL